MTKNSYRRLCAVMAALLLILLIAMCSQRQCLSDIQPVTPLIELHIDTLWLRDTVREYRPVLVADVPQPQPVTIDTAAILSAYFAARAYADTLHISNVATAYVLDTVSQNSLVSRSVSFDVAQLSVTATCQPIRPRPPRLALTAGLQIGRNQALPYAGLRLRRTEMGVGYDLRLHTPSITIKYDLFQWQ